MGLRGRKSIASRFMRYVQGLVEVIGHADRAGPLEDYCTGLVAASGRKSVEPMAAITAPERTAAQHQSLLHFVGQGAWSDDAVLANLRKAIGVATRLTAAELTQCATSIRFVGRLKSGWRSPYARDVGR